MSTEEATTRCGHDGKNLLTVVCTTYNHVKYIAQALDGFIRQKTNFNFVVLVGDDASTDGTSDIIRNYAGKYPEKIIPVIREYNWGAGPNAADLYRQVCTKYLAICEGDDYWTDENKLQKQVDFLESHPDYSICFHPVSIINDETSLEIGVFPTAKTRCHKLTLALDDLVKENFIQTNSVVYRWLFDVNDSAIITYINEEIQPGDYILHLLHAERGKIRCLDEVMSVYRRHLGGMWTGALSSDEWFMTCGAPFLKFLRFLEQRYSVPQQQLMRSTAVATIIALLKARKFAAVERISSDYPELYEQAFSYVESAIPRGKQSKLWRKVLSLLVFRYSFLSKITWGRRKQRYLKKIHDIQYQLDSLFDIEY